MNAKRVVTVVVIVFLGFWMFTDPHGLAAFTQATGDSVGGWGQQLFSSLIEFLGDL
jgi:hypothetical protein